jgi:uncharacterized membrane protein
MWWNGLCHAWNNGALSAWGWIGIGLNLLFWGALIVGSFYLISIVLRRAGGGHPSVPFEASSSGLRIAQERYACGEIGREEYLNLMEDLK